MNLPAMQNTCKRVRFHPWVSKLLLERNGNLPSILSREISWTEELGSPLYSRGSQKVGQDRVTKQYHNNSKFRSKNYLLKAIFLNHRRLVLLYNHNITHILPLFNNQLILSSLREEIIWCLFLILCTKINTGNIEEVQ